MDVRVTVDSGAAAGADESLIDGLLAMDGVSSVTLGDEYKAESGDLFYNVLVDSPTAEADVARALEERFSSDESVEVLSLTEEAERDARSRLKPQALRRRFRLSVLACIGISDVFSSALGRIPERRREVSSCWRRASPQAGEKDVRKRGNPHRGQAACVGCGA